MSQLLQKKPDYNVLVASFPLLSQTIRA